MTTVSEIEDFTDKLNENTLSFNFNPSIAHWKEDLYLVCYRTYLKNFANTTRGFAKANDDLPNHPWHNPPWNSEKGYDRTGFVLIRITNRKISLYKELNKGYSIYYHIEENIHKSEDKNITGVDARLIKLQNNSFLISYNKLISSWVEIKEGNCSSGSGCNLIATRIINLTDDGNLYFQKEMILCNQISNSTEKNWSFFKHKEQLFFSYGLSPKHITYSLYLKDNTVICGSLASEDKYEYYGNYEKNVNPEIKNQSNSDSDSDEKQKIVKKILHISVSTPAIPIQNKKDRYIAVGHVKFRNTEKKAGKIRSKPFEKFYAIISEKRGDEEEDEEDEEGDEKLYRQAPNYDYLMFLYEFDPTNGHITGISDMFIPEDSKYLLAFPTGLTYIDDQLWIFYGDHDSNCKVIKIKSEYVSKLLKETPEDTEAFFSGDINYFIFPKICLTKSDICNLLLSF
tara:strand:- start:2185 stop:3549 length:1365 start_codon:yes stop_codon:yes gene_type:complete